jgi:hypothetical protein
LRPIFRAKNQDIPMINADLIPFRKIKPLKSRKPEKGW